MSVTINAKGTSTPYFKIGKRGTTLFQGSTDPSTLYEPVDGDFWLNNSTNSLSVKSANNWIAPILGVTNPLIFPVSSGDNGQVLSTDGQGNLTWISSSGSGTVTSASVVSANGFAGTVANSTTTPAITISTSVTGLIKGNGTAISSATAGTDYSAGTASLETGILKTTTSTGNLSIAVASDFPTLNQNTTGTANNITGIVSTDHGGTGLTLFSANQIFYAGDANTISQSSGLTYNGANTLIIGSPGYGTVSSGDGESLRLGSDNSNNIIILGVAGDLSFAGSVGTTGQVLTSQGANTSPTWTTITSGVSSFSASTTGLTPNTATTGAIVLGGTLNAAHGGTGLTSFTANEIFYAGDANTISQSAGLTYNGANTLVIGSSGNATVFAGAGEALRLGSNSGNNIIVLGAAGDLSFASSVGTVGQVLTSQGANTSPTWTTITSGVSSFSGNGTGLTPNTATTGDIVLDGILNISHGGTGAITANEAFNNLVPSQVTNNGKYLTTDGANTSWSSVTTGTVTSISVNGTPNNIVSTGSPITSSGTITIDLANTSVVANTYTYASLTVDSYGRLTSATSNTPVTSFSAGTTGLTPNTATTGTVVLDGTLTASHGGTGLTSFVANEVFYAGDANTISQSAGLTYNGANTLVVGSTGNGGRVYSGDGESLRLGSNSGNNVIILGSAGDLSVNGSVGTTGQVLTSQGANTSPTWTALPSVVSSFSAGTTGLTPNTATTGAVTLDGILNVSHGGTGVSTLTGYVYGNGTGAFTANTAIPGSAITGAISGNANTATTLQTSRTISSTGDATWSVNFDGASNVSSALTLATVNSSPQTDTFRKVTVNAKGLVTATSAVSQSDITTSLGYTPVNKAGDTMTGLLILSGDPVNVYGAVTKQYADNIASGVNIHAACDTATATALPACTYDNGVSGVGATLTANSNGTLGSVGGYAGLIVGSRVLVKNQVTTTQNGIYVVTQLGTAGTPWILTRSSDFDGTPTTEVQAGDLTYVQQGTSSGTQWVQITIGGGQGTPPAYNYVIIGTDPIVFTQFAGSGTYSAGSGINIDTNVISNSGVLSNLAGTGIGLSGNTGNVTITNTGVTSLTGTANQITASASTGAVTLSLPSSVTISGTLTANTFSGSGASLTNLPASALTGTIPDSILGNSTLYVGTTAVTLNRASANQGLTGITSLAMPGATSGTITLTPAATAGTTAIIVPATAGTLVTTGDTGTVTNTMLAGSIANAKLANSAVTIGTTAISLGSSNTTLAGLTSVTSTTFIGAFNGNANTATALQTSRTISATGDATWSVNFDGSANATAALTLATVATAGTYKSVTIDVKGRVTAGTNPTTLAGYGITDAVSNTGNSLPVTYGNISSAQLITSTTSANQVVDSFSTSTYRTVKYLVQATSSTSYQSSEIMIIHNGTTAFISEYGTVMTNTSLASFDADVSGGNVRLLVTPTNAVTTINVVRTTIIV